MRFPRLSGMVPVSWLEGTDLHQWEHKAKTMQSEDGKDGVRFTSITRLTKHGSVAAGEE